MNNALTQFADRVYRMQAKRVSAGQAAAYEPLQFRVLADQVRGYRGAYQRYQGDPDADFNDVVTSQQTLAGTISTGDRWLADDSTLLVGCCVQPDFWPYAANTASKASRAEFLFSFSRPPAGPFVASSQVKSAA